MGKNRLTRVNELLKREIAGTLFRVMDEKDFDLAAVTVTRVETGSDLRQAQVYVSIVGDREQQRRMLNLLRKHRAQIQSLMSRHVVLKYTPHLYFRLDDSLRTGDHVLRLIEQLDVPPDEDADAEPPPGGDTP